MSIVYEGETPPIASSVVLRPRLFKQLDRDGGRLATVAAPVGFGKTTLLAEWCRHLDAPFVWVSLDQLDNNPVRFSEVINQVAAAFSRPVDRTQADCGQALSLDGAFERLADAMARPGGVTCLVLDDYHFITDNGINSELVWFLHRMPDAARLVILSDVTPPFSRASWRARGQLVEISSADLALTESETAECLRLDGLSLSSQACRRVHDLTSGWLGCVSLVRLRLGQLSEAQREAYVDRCNTSDVYLRDWISTEIIGQCSSELQDFMRQTSVLSRLNVSLCNFVLDTTDSEDCIFALARLGLVEATDETCEYFTYQAMVRDYLLRDFEGKGDREASRAICSKASVWHESRGEFAEAADYALSSRQIDRAWDLLDRHFNRVGFSGDPDPDEYLAWRIDYLKLPDDRLLEDPELTLEAATSCVLTHDRDRIARPLSLAEAAFAQAGDALGLGRVYSLRSAVAIDRGKTADAIAYALKALELLPDSGHDYYASTLLSLSQGYYSRGQYGQAVGSAKQAYTRFLRSRNVRKSADACLHLAKVDYFLCEMDESDRLCRQVVSDRSPLVSSGQFGAMVLLGTNAYNRNDLKTAERYYTAVVNRADERNAKGVLSFAYVGLAKIYDLQKRREKSLQSFEAARAHAQIRKGWSSLAYVESAMARSCLRRNDVAQAEEWIASVAAAKDVGAQRPDRNGVFYAQVWLAFVRIVNKPDDRLRAELERCLVERLVLFNENCNRFGSLECAILLSLVRYVGDDEQGALEAIEAALAIAEPCGLVRPFLDADPLVERVLSCAEGGRHAAFSRHVLGLYRSQPSSSGREASLVGAQITPREREVLRLMNQGASTTDIAAAFVISEATVRTHIRNILSKLEVHSRQQALMRAKDMDLL